MRDLIRPCDFTELVIRPEVSSEPRLLHSRQVVVQDRTLKIRMSLQAGDREVCEYLITMKASDTGADWDELRPMFLRNAYLEINVHAPKSEKPDWEHIRVRVEDDKGILAWLFPNGDFSFIHKTLRANEPRQLNEPLQLPAGS